jgi:hydroxymethylbilane synthase
VRILLATRGSTLALWQTRHVAARLRTLDSALAVEQRIIHTTGDRITDVPLARIGETALFTKQLDQAVLVGDVDAAVHSLKDVPTRPADGLRIAAILERADARDAFVPAPRASRTLAALPAGARIGTSSLRRRALLRTLRPDLLVEDLRGNLDTRIVRLDDGHLAGAIVAAAGLHRLRRDDVIGELLSPPAWLPAPGQGALAVVTRDDDACAAPFTALDHAATRTTVTAERAFLRDLEGGCQIPIGALARVHENTLTLHGFVADDAGPDCVRGDESGSAAEPAAVGERLADRLRAAGADAILERVRQRALAGRPVPHTAAP